MKTAVKLLICLVSLAAGGLGAQSAAGRAAPPSNNRYLLIVDTSRAMEFRARGTLKAVQDLLASGMGGQMKRGDTLGVWTYNADLYTGRLPLQRWSPEGQKAIAKRVLGFLRGQRCEKAANLDNVLVAMERVIKDSEQITVILVSAGDGQVRGTPFDDRISEFCQRWRDKQNAARMPFVIVLRARNGVIADYTLNTPPWSVQMPYLPVETQMAGPPPAPAPETPRLVPPPTAPPLIISGKKTQPLPEPKPAESAPAKPATPAPAPPSEAGKKEGLPTPPAVAVKAEAPKAATVKVAAPAPSPTAAINASAPAKVEPAKAEPPKPSPPVAEAAKAQPASALVVSAPVPPAVAPAPPIQIAKPAPEVVTVPKPAPAPEVKPPPAPPATPAASNPQSPPPPAVAPPVQIAAAVPAKTPEILPKPPVGNSERPREPKHPQAGTSAEGARPPAAAPAAVAALAESSSAHKHVWIAGVVLAGLVLGGGWLLLRRSRATAHASLITRSLDREEKDNYESSRVPSNRRGAGRGGNRHARAGAGRGGHENRERPPPAALARLQSAGEIREAAGRQSAVSGERFRAAGRVGVRLRAPAAFLSLLERPG